MPALHNPRHERFARAWIKLGVASEAYRKAGYKADKPGSVWTSAWRMLRHEQVQRRIRELKKQMATRNRITVDSLVEELDEARVAAMALSQPSAAISASMSKARLVGLIVDRKEQGAPGDFAAMQTEEQVLAAVRAELGEGAAAALAAALTHQAAPAVAPEPMPIEVERSADDTLN